MHPGLIRVEMQFSSTPYHTYPHTPNTTQHDIYDITNMKCGKITFNTRQCYNRNYGVIILAYPRFEILFLELIN